MAFVFSFCFDSKRRTKIALRRRALHSQVGYAWLSNFVLFSEANALVYPSRAKFNICGAFFSEFQFFKPEARIPMIPLQTSAFMNIRGEGRLQL